MFKRRWKWFGKLVSDEGFTLAYGNRSITYSDPRGSFQFGLEDGFLFPTPAQIAGEPRTVEASELHKIIERVISGIRSEGHAVELYASSPSPPQT
jgi:hypothetical protein